MVFHFIFDTILTKQKKNQTPHKGGIRFSLSLFYYNINIHIIFVFFYVLFLKTRDNFASLLWPQSVDLYGS